MMITPKIISYGYGKEIMASPAGVRCKNGLNTQVIKIRPHPVGINASRLVKRLTNLKWVNSAIMTIITSKELGKPIVDVFFCSIFVLNICYC